MKSYLLALLLSVVLGTGASPSPEARLALWRSVTAQATDPSDGMVLSGKALIHWHWAFEGAGDQGMPSVTRPNGALVPMADGSTKAVQAVQVGDLIKLPDAPGEEANWTWQVTDKEINPDGSVSLRYTVYISPDENPDAPGYDEVQYTKKIKRAYDDVVKEGARDVKLALEAYEAVAENFAYGPFYNLGTEALVVVGGKALNLLTKAEKAKVALAAVRGALSKVQGLAVKLKARLSMVQAGSEEAATLARNIDELEEGARKLASGVDELEDVAAKSNEIGTEFKSITESAQEFGANTAAGKNCFIAGTLVRMANGALKPIEQVKAGDLVLSRDPQTGQCAGKKVLRTFKHQAHDTLALQLPNGEHIQCTPEHSFYVVGQGFTPAEELGIGTSIVTRAGPMIAPEKIDIHAGSATVYNFEVADFHTYFVGRAGLWVHNICEIPTGSVQNANNGVVKEVNFINRNPALTGHTQGESITRIDVLQKDANGANWLIEQKGATGFYHSNPTQPLSPAEANQWVQKHVVGSLDDMLACLRSHDPELIKWFGTDDEAMLLGMLQNGQIRLGIENTEQLPLRIRYRITHAIRQWEQSHAAVLGGRPIGLRIKGW